MKTPLVVLGDYAWDVLIRTNTRLLEGGDTYGEVMLTPGGSAANVAVWASRSGIPTRFVGKIGRDRFGELAGEELADEGVEAYLVRTEAQLTGSVAVFVDHRGERSMVSGRGADHYLLPSELPVDLLANTRHLHLTAWSFFADPPRTAARRAAKLAKEAGSTISFDPGSFQMIEEMGLDAFLECTTDLGVDLLLPNHEEGTTLTGEREPQAIASELARLYPGALIALKLDAEGSLILADGTSEHIPPATDRLVDATGAGDSYAGAFLARFLNGRSACDAARFATRVSAWTIQKLGARPAADAELKAILAEG
ncbi:MAG TPA: carbohydrate kinase family protein [Trueperaceae bacterium]